MLGKFIIMGVCLVGGYASITGTLPACLIALFGSTNALSVKQVPKPSIESLPQDLENLFVDWGLGGIIGAAGEVGRVVKDLGL